MQYDHLLIKRLQVVLNNRTSVSVSFEALQVEEEKKLTFSFFVFTAYCQAYCNVFAHWRITGMLLRLRPDYEYRLSIMKLAHKIVLYSVTTYHHLTE